MKWEKKGLIYEPINEYGWICSHAQIPTVLVLEDRMRIYFATRPHVGESYIAMMDVDIENPKNIIKIYDKPVMTPGNQGEFDEHGVMPNWVERVDDKIYMTYVGWSRRTSIPYSNWQGLAVSKDEGLSFEKCFKGPILDRTRTEILSATGLFAYKKDDVYYGFYANGTKWCEIDGKLESTYNIVSAYSKDLVNWENRNGKPIFSEKSVDEATTRPTIIELNNRYHMWFCYRGVNDYRNGINSYSIGYAYSDDLVYWTRDDSKAGIVKSTEGWDSKMTAYPYVVKAKNKIYMFYNGNGFGQSGFGYAELVED